MIELLSREYPAPTGGKRSIVISILFGLFVGFFLLFFEPFEITEQPYKYKTLKILFFGLISTIVLIVFLALLPEFFPRLFKNENWRVKHQILYYLLILIIISTLNGLYINYLENLAFSWANYWWIIKRTVMLGAIPLCFLILIDHNLKLTKYLNLVRELRLHLNNIDKTSFKQKHKLKSHSDFKKIMIDEKSFKYAESEGNYSTIFSQINQSEEKSLQRISLNYIEENITSSHIIRCHRSYIVNLYMVTQITGNAQGLKLEIENSEKKIPVSRKYIPIIKSFLSNQ